MNYYLCGSTIGIASRYRKDKYTTRRLGDWTFAPLQAKFRYGHREGITNRQRDMNKPKDRWETI